MTPEAILADVSDRPESALRSARSVNAVTTARSGAHLVPRLARDLTW